MRLKPKKINFLQGFWRRRIFSWQKTCKKLTRKIFIVRESCKIVHKECIRLLDNVARFLQDINFGLSSVIDSIKINFAFALKYPRLQRNLWFLTWYLSSEGTRAGRQRLSAFWTTRTPPMSKSVSQLSNRVLTQAPNSNCIWKSLRLSQKSSFCFPTKMEVIYLNVLP